MHQPSKSTLTRYCPGDLPPHPERESSVHKLTTNPVLLTRLFFVLISTLIGYWLGRGFSQGPEYALGGLIIATIIVVVEVSTDIISSKDILLASLGLMGGLVISWFVYPTIPPAIFGDADRETGQLKARILCNLVFGYFGIILAVKHAHRISFSRLNFILASPGETAKIVDTSVIIDGRIKEMLMSNFLTGNLLLPEFVLNEMQRVADSADPKKRARGRRGLQVLEEMRNISPRFVIWEKDFPDIKDVDQKLIALAKEIGGEIVTNDYNLQKVAQLHQVRVLNINELANLLKPSVFVGEDLTLYVAREGKEANQGVGYLEDGTMVVIEEGKSRIGQETDVQVTSILQTPAGRMIFAKTNVDQYSPADGSGSHGTDSRPPNGSGAHQNTPQPFKRPRERV